MTLPSPGSQIDLKQIYDEYYKTSVPSSNLNIAAVRDLFSLGSGESDLGEFYDKEVIIPEIKDWRGPLDTKDSSGSDLNLGNGTFDCSINIGSVDLPTTYSHYHNISWESVIIISNRETGATDARTASTYIGWRSSTNGGLSWSSITELNSNSLTVIANSSDESVTSGTFNLSTVSGTNILIELILRTEWDMTDVIPADISANISIELNAPTSIITNAIERADASRFNSIFEYNTSGGALLYAGDFTISTGATGSK